MSADYQVSWTAATNPKRQMAGKPSDLVTLVFLPILKIGHNFQYYVFMYAEHHEDLFSLLHLSTGVMEQIFSQKKRELRTHETK